MLENRKELDKKLHEIEEREALEKDSENIRKYKNNIGLEYIRRDAIRQYDLLQQEYIQANMDMCVGDMDIVNSVFEFLRNKS